MDSEDLPMLLTQDGAVTIVDKDRGWKIMAKWHDASGAKPDGAKLEMPLASVDDFKKVMDGTFTRLLEGYCQEFFEYLAPHTPFGFQSILTAVGSEYRYRVNVKIGKKRPMRFRKHMAFEEGNKAADGNRLYDIEGAVLFQRDFFFLMTAKLVEAGILPSELGSE